MLFGQFPFDSPEGDKEPHYFQRVLERIQRVGPAFRCAAAGRDESLSASILRIEAT